MVSYWRSEHSLKQFFQGKWHQQMMQFVAINALNSSIPIKPTLSVAKVCRRSWKMRNLLAGDRSAERFAAKTQLDFMLMWLLK